MTNNMMPNRIYFLNNPYPNGHLIKEFVWTGRIIPDKGIYFDFHLETEEYCKETPRNNPDEDIDWESPGVWENYGQCTISSYFYGNEGILIGSKDKPFNFQEICNSVIYADTLTNAKELIKQDTGFHIYILGHDSCANHRFELIGKDKKHSIKWSGKIALSYAGQNEYKYDFQAIINDVTFSGFKSSPNHSKEDNIAYLRKSIIDFEKYDPDWIIES